MLFPALFALFAGWMLAMTYVPVAVGQIYSGTDPATMVGIVLGAGGFVALVLGPALGALADKVGMWRVLIAGAVIEVLLWPLLAVFRDLNGFAVIYALVNGLGSGVFALSFSVLAASASSQVRGRVMAFAYLPVNIGVMIGPAIGSLVTKGTVFAASRPLRS
jgi:MFS family permease